MTGPIIPLPDRLAGALYGSLIGDAMTLAAHWIYDPEEIKERFDRITDYVDPGSNQYHGNKSAGDFTHYGDQALTLMESITLTEGFSVVAFEREWKEMWKGYHGYVDGATRSTLQNGHSDSHDLGGAARIAPVIAAFGAGNRASLIQAAKQQTSFTHASPEVIDCAVFFTVVSQNLILGKSLEEALHLATSADYQRIDAPMLVQTATEDQSMRTETAFAKYGRSCPVESALPGTLYLILKHQDSYEAAIEENVLVGGDSAARGLLIGLVLGLHLGIGHIPETWIRGLSKYSEVASWLKMNGIGNG